MVLMRMALMNTQTKNMTQRVEEIWEIKSYVCYFDPYQTGKSSNIARLICSCNVVIGDGSHILSM